LAVAKKKASKQKHAGRRKTKKAVKPEAKEEAVAPATAEAILGGAAFPPNPPPKKRGRKKVPTAVPDYVKPEWAKYYRRLVELRDRLLDQMEGLAKESAEQIDRYSVHMADSGTDNFDRDFALSLLSSDQEALYEIEEALKRIEKGTYGICELTGKPIPKARLDAIPWTRFTVEAQAQLEKEGVLRHRRFANLGSAAGVGADEQIGNEGETDTETTADKEI